MARQATPQQLLERQRKQAAKAEREKRKAINASRRAALLETIGHTEEMALRK